MKGLHRVKFSAKVLPWQVTMLILYIKINDISSVNVVDAVSEFSVICLDVQFN